MAKKVGRNDACPCRSGKKYKKCCMPMYEAIGYRAELLEDGVLSLVGSLDGSPVPEGGFCDCPVCQAPTIEAKIKAMREINAKQNRVNG